MEYSDTEDLNEIIGQEDLFSDDSNDEKIEREGRNSEKNLKGNLLI